MTWTSAGWVLTVNAFASTGTTDALDVDRLAGGAGQQPGCLARLVPAVAHVGLSGAVDQERVAADPDPGSAVVLGVDREHPARPDGEHVDVDLVADGDRVDEAPAGIGLGQSGQLLGDQPFPDRPALPGRVRVLAQPEASPPRRPFACVPGRRDLVCQLLTRTVVGQVGDRGPCGGGNESGATTSSSTGPGQTS